MSNSIGNIWNTLEGEVVEGKYHLRRLINSGGFGGVFEADEVVADKLIRQVAIKLITPDTELADRQIEELTLAAALDHPSLLRCFSPGQCSVSNIVALYMVMELASSSVATQLTNGVLPETTVRSVLDSLLSALIYLGSLENPLVHRDVKPDNVLLVGNTWKLADFGLLRGIGPQRVARTQNLLGTAEYAPPEAFDGVISQAWDMWSVGVMLVEMLTTKLPFDAPTHRELQNQIHSGRPQNVDNLPEPFRAIAKGTLFVERDGRLTAEQALGMLRGSVPLTLNPAGPRLHAAPRIDERHRKGRYPFRFKFGAADTIEELIDLCDEFPYEAQEYLVTNYFQKWFSESMNDPSLAKESRQIGQLYWQDPVNGVELLTRTLCQFVGRAALPEIKIDPDRVDFGMCSVGAKLSASLTVKTTGRGHVWGSVRIEGNVPGLTTRPFGADGGPIAVHLDAGKLAPDHYQGTLLVEAYGFSEPIRIPVSYSVAPLRAKISHKSISFDEIPYGATRIFRITVESSDPKASVSGDITIFPPCIGVSVTPNFSGANCEIDITVDSDGLDADRDYVRRVRITSNAGRFEVPMRFRVAGEPKKVAGRIAVGAFAGATTFAILRGIVNQVLPSGTWAFDADVTTQQWLFRSIGSPIVALVVSYLFRRFAQWRWPLLFEQAQQRPAISADEDDAADLFFNSYRY